MDTLPDFAEIPPPLPSERTRDVHRAKRFQVFALISGTFVVVAVTLIILLSMNSREAIVKRAIRGYLRENLGDTSYEELKWTMIYFDPETNLEKMVLKVREKTPIGVRMSEATFEVNLKTKEVRLLSTSSPSLQRQASPNSPFTYKLF